MNTSTNRTAVASRIAAVFAATTITALILASQVGLAGHYKAEADAIVAAKRAAPLALNATTPAASQQVQGS